MNTKARPLRAGQTNDHWLYVAMALERGEWLWNIDGSIADIGLPRLGRMLTALNILVAALFALAVWAVVDLAQPTGHVVYYTSGEKKPIDWSELVLSFAMGAAIPGLILSATLYRLTRIELHEPGRGPFTPGQRFLRQRFPGSCIAAVDTAQALQELQKACEHVNAAAPDDQLTARRLAEQSRQLAPQFQVARDMLLKLEQSEEAQALSASLDASFRELIGRLCLIRQHLAFKQPDDSHAIRSRRYSAQESLSQLVGTAGALLLLFFFSGPLGTLVGLVAFALMAHFIFAGGRPRGSRSSMEDPRNTRRIAAMFTANERVMNMLLQLQLELIELRNPGESGSRLAPGLIIEELRDLSASLRETP